MADSGKVEEVRVLKRGGGAAATFAFLALLLAVFATIMAFRADNRAQNAESRAQQAISKQQELQTKIDNALGTLNKATPGGGVGENTPQPSPSGNPLPNANGQ